MFGYEKIELKDQKGKYFSINIRKLLKELKEIEFLIDEYGFLKDYSEPKREIVEGVIGEDTKQRRINQVNGYKFILNKPDICESKLHELYSILSVKQLDEDSKLEEEKSYRKKEVLILDKPVRSMMTLPEFDRGIHSSLVKEYMDSLFEYLDKKDLNPYIKSQIAHFYFVYIHPFYDVNGRTARTISSWLLVKDNKEPYTILNRGISFNRHEYLRSIKKSRKGDLTTFIDYTLKTIKQELQRQISLEELKEKYKLTSEENETLELILRLKNKTLSELRNIFFYQKGIYDNKIITKRLLRLIEKNVITYNRDTKLITIIGGAYESRQNRKFY